MLMYYTKTQDKVKEEGVDWVVEYKNVILPVQEFLS